MLKVNNIHKSYYQKKVINDLSFSVQEGEIYGLLGPNGAGKTSVLRILNKIIEPEKGDLYYNKEILQFQHLKKFGYLPEERGLYKSMTVWKHLLLFAHLKELNYKEAKKRVSFWLEKLNILSWKDKKIEQLSKGMAQKIQFIACLIHQPQLIILDEPFSGFDPLNIDLFEQILIELKKEGKSIIISSHNMKSVETMCDRALLIQNGQKIIEGSVSSWKKDYKKNIYSIKFKGNMLAFANALWSNFELLDKKEIEEGVFEAIVKMRHENNFQDLIRSLLTNVEIIKAEEVFPDLQQIFVDLVTPLQTETTPQ
ncbi:MAG: ABC transporter ATP-binding protein [Flavobacteriia bacterium]|nr:ABC transporter ATP-binding protein [Flavobacteriia bacterium]